MSVAPWDRPKPRDKYLIPRPQTEAQWEIEKREVKKKIGCSMEPIEPKILKDGEMCRLLHGADPNQDQEINTSFPDPRQT